MFTNRSCEVKALYGNPHPANLEIDVNEDDEGINNYFICFFGIF